MRDKVIDCFIEVGAAEKDALDRCAGYRELCWGESRESEWSVFKRLREHFNTPHPEIPPMTIELLIENMDEANVKYAILQGVDHEDKGPWKTKKPWKKSYLQAPADYIKELIDKYPSRFKGIAGINPFKPRDIILTDIEKYIKDWGFVGIELFPFSGFMVNDKELLYPIYEKCLDLDAIVSIISSGIGIPGPRIRYVHPLAIDDVAQDFPELKIHITHGGEGPLYGQEVLHICFHSLNVYTCTSPGWLELPTGIFRHPDLMRQYMEMIPDKIMFSSNYPFGFPIKAAIEAIENMPGLTEEFKNKLFYENAARFYGSE